MWPLKRSALSIGLMTWSCSTIREAAIYRLRSISAKTGYTLGWAPVSPARVCQPAQMLPLGRHHPGLHAPWADHGRTHVPSPTQACALQLNETDHAILISGESGAGKTEATKQVLSFLADAAGSEDNVEQRILMANPVLEAYGNAKTLRNNNSSRFGKWIEVHFDRLGRAITSASIENFLLEKSRVVRQQKDERNYHIFYQLCCSDSQSRMLRLDDAKSYRYLSGGQCIKVKGMDDEKEFEEVEAAMKHLHFEQDEKSWMFELTAGVLTLGNVEFIKHKAQTMSLRRKLQLRRRRHRCRNAGSGCYSLTNCLKRAHRGARRKVSNELDPDAARDGTDALAKVGFVIVQ